LETVKKLLIINNIDINDIEKYIDLSYNRPGMDVRYSLNDSKLRSLGWEPRKQFDVELKEIVKYYRNKFIW
jgi:dTDP-glucose 4,6-dehydratase